MHAPPHPRNAARLESLRSYGALDNPRSANFDEIAQLVSDLCDVPMAAISLVDSDRQWFLGESGLGIRTIGLEVSLCAHAILGSTFLEVPDLTDDVRFSDNPLVTGDMGLRFYAGAVLVSPEGLPLGTLCALDLVPRRLTSEQRQILRTLARRVMVEIEAERQARQVADLTAQLDATRADRKRILNVVSRDMRKSLNTVGLSARLMARGAAQAEQGSAFTRRLQRATQHMHRLVDHLTEPAHLLDAPAARRLAGHAVGRGPAIHPLRVRVDAVILGAVEAAEAAFEGSGAPSTVVIPDDIGEAVWDADRVRQALGWVIEAILRITPVGSWVSLWVDVIADDIVINIVGAGDGASAESRAASFERRADNDDAPVDGLDMAKVRAVAEAHGGSVTAHRAVGQGTEVRIRLPRFTATDGA